MSVHISAVICTHNRAHYLRKALSSLAEQTLPKEQYEILVIDNCSTDETQQIVQDEFGSTENLRYLYEPQIGLSHARNSGWQAAAGRYVAYLDDDAIASPTWLATLVNDFETLTPQPACISGKIDPIWEAERPKWLPDALLPYLTVLDWGEQATILDANQYAAGANMAFTKSVLEQVGGFKGELGRQGDNLLSNEELVLQNDIRDLGLDIFYDPQAVVEHHVVAERLQQRWFEKRTYWQGISEAFLFLLDGNQSYSRLNRMGLCVPALFNLLLSPKQVIASLVPSNDPRLVEAKCHAFNKVGYIVGLLTAEVTG